MKRRMLLISLGMFAMGIVASIQDIEEAGIMYVMGALFMIKSMNYKTYKP
jgi:hypothetical protein